MKSIAKIKDSTIHDDPTDKMDIGEKIKDKIKERSVRYTRRYTRRMYDYTRE